jgi:hypothetical protein
MRYAIIDGSTVVNVIDYDAAPDNPPPGFDDPVIAVQSDTAGPGWLYDGKIFTDPTPPAPQHAPLTVTPLQARRALRAAGLLPTVNAWVAAQADEDIKDAWEYASIIERNGPLTTGAALALGLTDAQLDGLFLAASKL